MEDHENIDRGDSGEDFPEHARIQDVTSPVSGEGGDRRIVNAFEMIDRLYDETKGDAEALTATQCIPRMIEGRLDMKFIEHNLV